MTDKKISELVDQVDMLSKTLIDEKEPVLDDQEAKHATQTLVKPLFRAVVRVKNDPPIDKQEFALISFTPASGAVPNRHGIYGIAKIRGTAKNISKADALAERIVKEVDSVNEIYTVKVGQDFPLTKEVRFIEQTHKVDLSDEVNEIKKVEERKKMEDDKRNIKIIKEREKKLLEERETILKGTYEEDPLETYTMLQVKRSQLLYVKKQKREELRNKVKPAIRKTMAEIQKLEAEHPDFKDKYYQRYMEARHSAGIREDYEADGQLKFVDYLLEYELSDDEVIPVSTEQVEA